MIITDKKLEMLEKADTPIKVGIVGAGFFARGVALQFVSAAVGMRLVAIANRTPENAIRLCDEVGIDDVVEVESQIVLDAAIQHGKTCVTNNPFLLCKSDRIDVIIEATGNISFGAQVVLSAIEHRKHVIVNAELDGTVGPILKIYADKAGVIFTDIDGDQPGVIMNLYRFIKGVGIKPVLCGNIKGLHDPYRNPQTQKEFANKWGQNAAMVTSFADGSKISFEQAVIANATEMKVAKRGMYGPTVDAGTAITEAIKSYPDEAFTFEAGIVDYIVGAEPGPGIFIVGTCDHPLQQHYLKLYKLGDGPFYCFYTPFHLCHFEVPNTVARAMLFNDATIAPVSAPQVEVVAVAKRDLKAGQKIDGIGFYMTYGMCENSEVVTEEQLLPLGAAEDCILKRDVNKDEVLCYQDVELPEGRLIDQLLAEQRSFFSKNMAIE
ncbi:NAD(P)H-dependent oxidoreductase [Fodinibius sp. Rm-B-1B1-1]|uniref:NAD(P)H-dependent oxidoreductase n=1 Tax=Fodinibius alkaliphilus TaxID=3140241 RepID=UPI0038B36DA6